MSNPIQELVSRLVHRGLESFGRHYSCYRGFVLEDVDPKQHDRLFVHVPHISGSKKEGNWAWPKGKPHNQTLTPKKGDMVWVEFEYGDYRYPIWSYSNQVKDIRQMTNPHHKPGDIKWKTETGNFVLLDDTNDLIKVEHHNGSHVEIADEYIKIQKKDGGVIFLNKDGQVAIDGAEVIINGGNNGGLIVISELVSKINRLENIMNSHMHIVAGANTSTLVTPIIPITMESDLENPNVKH
jgi:hypothetical protein